MLSYYEGEYSPYLSIWQGKCNSLITRPKNLERILDMRNNIQYKARGHINCLA